jgi:hypothetical protein
MYGGTMDLNTFTGICQQGCTGDGVGTLTLMNYTLGDALTNSNFVNFVYNSNDLSYTITPTDFDDANDGIFGAISSALPATSTVSFTEDFGFFDQFSSSSDGSWCAGSTCQESPNLNAVDAGSQSLWSVASTASAPEPSSSAMLLVGGSVGFLLIVRRQK